MGEARLFTLEGARRRHPSVEAWFAKPPAELATVARRWFEVLRGCGTDVEDVLHDGHPTACVAGAAFAYVNAFTDHVNVGFFNGANLDDPAHLLEGSGRFMRHVKLGPTRAMDEAALERLIVVSYQDMKRLVAAAR